MSLGKYPLKIVISMQIKYLLSFENHADIPQAKHEASGKTVVSVILDIAKVIVSKVKLIVVLIFFTGLASVCALKLRQNAISAVEGSDAVAKVLSELSVLSEE